MTRRTGCSIEFIKSHRIKEGCHLLFDYKVSASGRNHNVRCGGKAGHLMIPATTH